MKKVMVRLDHLKKSFENKTIIQDFSLDVYEGEFLTLLGPSGCGKTTILRMISGLETVDSGHIFIDNVNVTDFEARKREVNTIFQNYALFPHMTIEKNIGYGLKIKKVNKKEIEERVQEMISLVQLDGLASRKPLELSGGQQQRVAIARGLINRPKVLLLDEPLSSLDLKLRKQMHVELKKLQKKMGITFIYVTHDQDEALSMSDRIVVMNQGYIQQIGTPKEIYDRPINRFVADFIGESNVFSGVVVDKTGSTVVELDSGLIFEANKHKFAVGTRVLVVLRPEDLKIDMKEKKINCFSMKIKDNVYNGYSTKIMGVTGDGISIKMFTTRKDDIYKKGTNVFVHFDQADVIVMKDEDKK